MASAADLWAALRARGLQDLAPSFVRRGVFFLEAVSENSASLQGHGVAPWQIHMLMGQATPTAGDNLLPAGRPDLPPVRKRRRGRTSLTRDRPRWTSWTQKCRPGLRQGPWIAASQFGGSCVRPFSLDATNIRCVAASDCIRSIRRGLGPSELKDSFDVACFARLVQPQTWNFFPTLLLWTHAF